MVAFFSMIWTVIGETMKIDVYTSKECQQCEATKLWLKREGLQFNEFDVLADPEAYERCKALGYTTLPVVVAGERHWSGFRFDQLRELK